jgi:hypothetical protein
MQQKGRFDPNSPEIKAYLDDLKHQFVREGTMVAFPLCLPGMTTPIPLDESRITALDINSDGHVYGGTSGRQAHVFAAAFHGLTGIVLDVGAVPGATGTEAVCCGAARTIAFVNGSRGGRAIAIPHIDLRQDWIQEWGLDPPVVQDLGECVPGEPVVHAVLGSGKEIVGITSHHLFTMDVESPHVRVVAEVPGRGRLALGRTGVFGQDDTTQLWRFDLGSGQVQRAALTLPQGEWMNPLRWARDSDTGLLFTADDAGRLFSFDETKGFRSLARVHLAPVGPMALAPDGRLFGVCGDGIANLFCCDTRSGNIANLGVAASVLEQRRYGYQFGDAVTGQQGEIMLGENDNGGHLWLYFPRITAVPRA